MKRAGRILAVLALGLAAGACAPATQGAPPALALADPGEALAAAPAAPADAPALTPGKGFDGPLASPRPASPGPKAIARWDVVPWQTFSGELTIGVVAFHIDGIDRVEFSAQGGAWVPVREMTLNPVTGVHEYCALLRAADFRDGPIEVRAVVYPAKGAQRVLAGALVDETGFGDHSLFLTANHGRTLPEATLWCDAAAGSDAEGDGSEKRPFATVAAAVRALDARGGGEGSCDGAFVLLREGSYALGGPNMPRTTTARRWLTVMGAPGTTASKVVIDERSDGLSTRLLRLRDLTVKRPGSVVTPSLPGLGPYLWLDRTVLDAGDRRQDLEMGGFDGVYVTDSVFRNIRHGPCGCRLVRGASLANIGEDAFSNSMLVVRSTVDGIDHAGTDFHPDLYQWWSGGVARENVILYNIRALNAGCEMLFAKSFPSLDNVAVVNVLGAERDGEPSGFASHWDVDSTDHLLLHNVSLPQQCMLFYKKTRFRNLSIRGSVFAKFHDEFRGDDLGGAQISDNHYVESESYGAITPGERVTTGDPEWSAPGAGDWSPGPKSCLRGRLAKPLVPVDAAGEPRTAPDSIGALR